MKKGFFLVLVLLLMVSICGVALAVDAEPGQEATVSFNFSTTEGVYATVKFSFDQNALQFVSATGTNGATPPQTANGSFQLNNGTDVIPSGSHGSITFKVKDSASAGTYEIAAIVNECYNNNFDDVSGSASFGSVTVKKSCTHEKTHETVSKEPKCEEAGEKKIVCDKCGETIRTEAISATGHDWGEWKITKQPAVGVAGEETRVCKNDSTHTDSRPIAALPETPCEHEHTSARVRVKGSCTEQEEVDIVCDDCGAIIGTEYGPKPAGHDWGDWEVTKPAAPGVAGEETRICKNDPSHTETRTIDPLPVVDPACPHTSVTWKKVKTAGCTTEGLSEKSCDECGKVFDSEIIPAMGHDDGEWVIVKKPTKTEDGLKQLVCTRKGCGEVLKEEIIPYVDSDWRMNQSVCSLGIRFRDIVPELTKKWYMFTPIDLSKDGTQTIDLIAANINYVGVVKVNVKGDKVTVNYTVRQPAEKRDMAFTILPDLASVTDVEIKNLNTYSFGKEISIADDLGGDTHVLLYVLGHVDYDFADEQVELFIPRGPQYDTLVNSMKNLMD